MAKKTRTTTKKTAKRSSAASAKKKTAKRAPAKKKAPARKTTTKKKAVTKKAPARKKTTKKAPAKKAASKKATTKKPAAKKAPAKKAPAKKTTKKTAKTTTKKPTTKKPATSKKATSSKTAAKATDDKGKPNRKGITIVSDRPKKRSAPKKVVAKFPPTGDRLLGPGSPVRKPLIPSGPSRAEEAKRKSKTTAATGKKAKSPFTKRELDKFKEILLTKRAELFGDMSQMESGALRSNSGGLSHTPQHFAEQGSESYDQSLALDLAAADRRLIIEIDDALKRIEDKTFGICELTGKPIKKTRLEELPWARHSIEAAREIERRSGFRA